MKLSELVLHTSNWLGVQHSTVESFARYLREAGQLSSGGRGVASAEMTEDDKISLFVAVCACGTARTSAQQLPQWLSLPYAGPDLAVYSLPSLKFLTQPNLKECLLTLFQEIQSGAVNKWGGERHASVSARFEIDQEAAVVTLERVLLNKFSRIEERESHSAQFNRIPQGNLASVLSGVTPLPTSWAVPGSHSGHSKLIREVSLAGLAGWGQCLTE